MLHLIVRSRNKSCVALRELIVPKRAIFRLGSTTPTEVILQQNHKNPKRTTYIEINTADACKISGNKLLMKQRFTRAHIPTAEWFAESALDKEHKKLYHYLKEWGTIIAKRYNSSGGKGIYLIKSEEDAEKFLNELPDSITNYIFEKYYTYSREYRIHVTKDGYFHASRKMLKADAEVRWHRHLENTVWVKEENPAFNKPANWDEIVEACVSALKAVGLDIGAMDVKIQDSKHENPKFIILESNSAPALGEETIEKYKQKLTTLIEERI